jgi:hypothetical protein
MPDCAGCVLSLDPFGIGSNQTVRINVANPTTTGATIVASIFDASGVLLRDFGRTTVAPGNITSFDLDGDSLVHVRDRFGRIQMRVVVTQMGGPEPRVSVEVIDNGSGKTTVFIGNPIS